MLQNVLYLLLLIYIIYHALRFTKKAQCSKSGDGAHFLRNLARPASQIFKSL
jgi:hypothetical protein